MKTQIKILVTVLILIPYLLIAQTDALKGVMIAESNAGVANHYFQIGEVSLTSQYKYKNITYEIVSRYGDNCKLHVSIERDASSVYVRRFFTEGMMPYLSFYLVETSNNVMELWLKNGSGWSRVFGTIVNEDNGGQTWTKTYNGSSNSSLPSGTVYTPGSMFITTRDLTSGIGSIGINCISSDSNLEIHQPSSDLNYARWTNATTESGSGNGLIIGNDDDEGSLIWNYENTEMYFGTNNNRRMTIDPSGKVGIGVSPPGHQLDILAQSIQYDSPFQIKISDASSDYFRIINGTGTPGQFIPTLNGYHSSDNRVAMSIMGEIGSGNDSGSDPILSFNDRVTGAIVQNRTLFKWSNYTSEKMRMTANGYLGLGTTNPSEMLTVNGKILAEEVRVTANVPASDYVFEPDYALKPIAEVEQFVKENKHLPDIPSAEEFKENGVGLGEMDDMLLRKIEELTLYVIEQEKSRSDQDKRLEELEKENLRLSNELAILKQEFNQ